QPFQVDRTVRYEYRDPSYDPWERSLKGFQRVRAIQPSGEGEQRWFWFGDCARDAFVARNCMKGSDEFADKGLVGVPVRIDLFKPGAGAEPDNWLMTSTMRYDRESTFIAPPGPRPDRDVTFARVGEIDTFVYDTALRVGMA